MDGAPVTSDPTPMAPRRADLAQLLREAGAAHHQAFAHVNGEDARWPEWYARWLLPRVSGPLADESVEGLALLLAQLDEEHRTLPTGLPWPEHYARRLVSLAARDG